MVIGRPQIFLVGLYPIAADFFLRLSQANLAFADFLMEDPFQIVLPSGRPFADQELRPDVFGIRWAPAEGQGDEVVHLIVLDVLIRIAVGRNLFLFHFFQKRFGRHVAFGPREMAGLTDGFLDAGGHDLGVKRSWSQ